MNLRFAWFRMNAGKYRGATYHCNICENGLNKMKPMTGRFYRENVCCPICSSLERQRLLWDYLKSSGLIDKKLNVLQFAPEYSFQKKLKTVPNWTYRSCDLYSGIAMDKEDIQNLSYEDGTYDLIIISHVMSHVEDDLKGYEEMKRVLKDDGCILLFDRIDKTKESTFTDPAANTPDLKLKIYGQDDLARIYGKDFFERIESTGLKTEVVDHYHSMDATYREKLRLNPNEKIFKLVKQ